jgi:biotin-dependent carboxylase-like uncharacterized protein
MLTVLDPGSLTTVQDRGRIGWTRYGIPPSGPMDAAAFAAANALVGNPPEAAGLEITLTGPQLRAHHDTLIAVCGAAFELWVDRLPVPCWHAVFVRAGALIRFGVRRSGARAYLAVAGGIDTPPFLGSRATYLRGAFGGHEGRALARGDRLNRGASSASTTAPNICVRMIDHAGRAWPQTQRPLYTDAPTLRVVLGPQDDHFTTEALDLFANSPYTLTPATDRMGIRLSGPYLQHARRANGTPADNIVSDAIVTGSVQVPPDGQPIVMMVDHQTTGGYPKIATVIQADLPLLAQCLPGNEVRFTALSPEQVSAVRHPTSSIAVRSPVTRCPSPIELTPSESRPHTCDGSHGTDTTPR